jgi:hypothetical protein
MVDLRRSLMDWRLKAVVQQVLSRAPGGERAYYELQTRLTHSLPISDERLHHAVDLAGRHLDAIRTEGKQPLEHAAFFEFGAGWDLHVPIILYAFGVRDQLVVDLFPLVRPALVQECLARLTRLDVLPPEQVAGLTEVLGALHEDSGRPDLEVITGSLGITYRAPADARRTGLAAGSIDYATSTSTLEHVPEQDIPAILSECRRLLRPGGIASMIIDYTDHYSHFDPSIGPFNFLRYDESGWRLFNPSLHYQNRLRHPQYLQLALDSGFEVMRAEPSPVSCRDLALLDGTPLSAQFTGFDREQLAMRMAHFVLRNP